MKSQTVLFLVIKDDLHLYWRLFSASSSSSSSPSPFPSPSSSPFGVVGSDVSFRAEVSKCASTLIQGFIFFVKGVARLVLMTFEISRAGRAHRVLAWLGLGGNVLPLNP